MAIFLKMLHIIRNLPFLKNIAVMSICCVCNCNELFFYSVNKLERFLVHPGNFFLHFLLVNCDDINTIKLN